MTSSAPHALQIATQVNHDCHLHIRSAIQFVKRTVAGCLIPQGVYRRVPVSMRMRILTRVYGKARGIAVPFALKPAIETRTSRYYPEGGTQPLWAAPVVSVPKGGGPGGQIRLCGDYKVTIYPELENDQYFLPKPKELFRKLASGKRFLKIDLTYASKDESGGKLSP